MNISATAITTTTSSAGRAVPGIAAQPGVAAANTATPSTRPGENTGGTPAETSRRAQDSIELSAKGLRLAQTIAEEVASIEVAPAQTPPKAAAEAASAEAELDALPGKEPLWETERRSKLERLETLVRQGLYKIDPFMLDEIAVRMAKMLF